MRSLLVFAFFVASSSSFALPKFGSIHSVPNMRRTPTVTAYANNNAKVIRSGPAPKARNVIAPAFSYAGLGAVAAGAAKAVTAAVPGYGMVTLGAIAAPALVLLLEFAFFGGGERVAKMMGGQEADSYITNIVHGVSEKAGLPPPPHVYEIPTDELNAFAAGFGSKDATVAVTTGLRKALSKRELEAVIAHEIGHIRHSDMSTNMHVAVAIAGLGGVYEAGRLLLRSQDSGSKKSKKDKDGSSAASTGLMLMAGGAMTRIVGHLMQLSMSRTAEYDADRVAAALCGPDAMISALGKIETYAKKGPAKDSPLRAGRAAAFSHAYISSGEADLELKDHGKEPGALEKAWEGATRLMSTHPRTKDRIAALRDLD